MNVLITGATGMLGRAVMIECIADSSFKKIYLLSRRPMDEKSDKVQEIIVSNFQEISESHFEGLEIDACFHCMGISSVGQSEESFSKVTFDVTKLLADVLYDLNPKIVFNYVSGTGSDSSEKGRVMWARVKGKTENYILNKGFSKAYMFRPGMILPEKGVRSRTKIYQFLYDLLRPFFPLFRLSNNVTTSTKVGLAMIHSVKTEFKTTFLENKEINELAKAN
jgi:hypothetical protein